jgi:phosphoribosylaminoimidazole-succinocarboxamide synthase
MVDPDFLARHADCVLDDATIPELPNHYRGKVRDNYDLPDGTRVIIATDRLSAFDRAIAAIPFKGQVLTQTARFWFDRTADLCRNHVLDYPDPNVLVGTRLDILPVEIVERGLLSNALWEEISGTALALFDRGRRMAAERGLILVDTKYEFGLDSHGRLVLADEVHTPDSSRYWFAESYERLFSASERPESFDKDFIRTWVTARCNPYLGPIPVIPSEVVLQAAQIYIHAFERISGLTFELPAREHSVLDRIRENLSSFF